MDLPKNLVLGTLDKLPPIREIPHGGGAASTFDAVLRAEGGPPWEILAHLDFGYGSKMDLDFARELVRRWNAFET